MADKQEIKVLLVGNVEGNFEQLFKRVETVNKKAGPFKCMFCVGKFFGDDQGAGELQPFLNGSAKVPLPTYFVDGLPFGREVLKNVGADGLVCPNLTFLKNSGVQEAQGLTVAFLIGRYDAISFKDNTALAASAALENGEYRSSDVTAVLKAVADRGKVPVDFLLTNEWGKGVLNGVKSPPKEVDPLEAGSPVVADLVKEVAPRYHVAGTENVFFARDPYKTERGNVTRFIALGSVGNAQKEKWMHALSVQPADSMPAAQLFAVPPGSSVLPYSLHAAPLKRPFEAQEEQGHGEGEYWRFQDNKKKKHEYPRVKPATLEGDQAFRIFVRNIPLGAAEADIAAFFAECGQVSGVRIGAHQDGQPKGFCHVQLDSADSVEAAMEMSGTMLMDREVQVHPPDNRQNRPPPTPAGGTLAGCWFCLSNPEADPSLVLSVGEHVYLALEKGAIVPNHVQLVPIDHNPNTLLLAPPAAEEYVRYVEALRKCFKQKLGSELLLFERFMNMRGRGGNHCFVGALPITAQAASGAQSVFEEMCQKAGFEFEVLPPAATWEMQRHELHEKLGYREYLTLTLPDNTVLLHQIGKGHPMNFAREVVASIIGKPERAAWKNCAATKEEEAQAAQKFSSFFSEYQPQ